jgi:hypothetical protein
MCVTLRPTVIYFGGDPQIQNRRFRFEKRSQYFVGAHNEALSLAAIRVNNPDRSPLRVNGRDPAQAPTGVAEPGAGIVPRNYGSGRKFTISYTNYASIRPTSSTLFRY